VAKRVDRPCHGRTSSGPKLLLDVEQAYISEKAKWAVGLTSC
jgi:hypothetical protein